MLAAFLVRAARSCASLQYIGLQISSPTAMAKPFAVQHVLELHGGHLNKPMKVACETVNGQHFTFLKKSDTGLAKALGVQSKTSPRSPFADCNLFDYIVHARNEAVDGLIRSHLMKEDIMADQVQIEIPADGRTKLFEDCKIQQVISVEMPGFVTPEGKRVEVKYIDMIATPKRNVSPCVEASPDVFEWLLHACQHTWSYESTATPNKRKWASKDVPHDLPTLPDPVKYMHVDSNKVVLYVSFKTTAGGWSRKQKLLDTDLYKQDLTTQARDDAILGMASILKDYYKENHQGKQHEETEEHQQAEEEEEAAKGKDSEGGE